MTIRNQPRDAAVSGIDIGKTVFHVVGLDVGHPCGQARSTPGSRKGSSQSLQCDRNQRQRCRGINAHPLAARQVDDHCEVFVSASRCRVLVHHRFRKNRRRRRLGQAACPFACPAQLAPPGVDQPRGDVMAAADIGNPGARRKRLGYDPQPFLVTPPSAPNRSRAPSPDPSTAQKHTLKSTLKSDRCLTRQGAPRRMDTKSARIILKHRGGHTVLQF